MKKIVIIPATGGDYLDITIKPGTTPRDVKAQLNLSADTVLTTGRGIQPFAEDANIYEQISDGAKLYSTTNIEWGAPTP